MPNPTERAIPEVLPLRDITEVLIKHFGHREGLYNLAFQFQVAVGAVGPTPETMVPGAMFGVAGIGLEKVTQAGPHTVDAAVVNPPSPAAKRTAAPKAAKKVLIQKAKAKT